MAIVEAEEVEADTADGNASKHLPGANAKDGSEEEDEEDNEKDATGETRTAGAEEEMYREEARIVSRDEVGETEGGGRVV